MIDKYKLMQKVYGKDIVHVCGTCCNRQTNPDDTKHKICIAFGTSPMVDCGVRISVRVGFITARFAVCARFGSLWSKYMGRRKQRRKKCRRNRFLIRVGDCV